VDGEIKKVDGKLDQAVVSWIHYFFSETAFGGLIESSTGDPSRALQDYDRPETLVFTASEVVRAQGSWLGLREVLAVWVQCLQQEPIAGSILILYSSRPTRKLPAPGFGSEHKVNAAICSRFGAAKTNSFSRPSRSKPQKALHVQRAIRRLSRLWDN